MNASPTVATIDVRTIPPFERHPLILSTFRGLATGQAMELVSDHDPRPLHALFMNERPAALAWDRLEAGPQTWRVCITQLESPGAGGRCCSCCSSG